MYRPRSPQALTDDFHDFLEAVNLPSDQWSHFFTFLKERVGPRGVTYSPQRQFADIYRELSRFLSLDLATQVEQFQTWFAMCEGTCTHPQNLLVEPTISETPSRSSSSSPFEGGLVVHDGVSGGESSTPRGSSSPPMSPTTVSSMASSYSSSEVIVPSNSVSTLSPLLSPTLPDLLSPHLSRLATPDSHGEEDQEEGGSSNIGEDEADQLALARLFSGRRDFFN